MVGLAAEREEAVVELEADEPSPVTFFRHSYQSGRPELDHNEHWVACKQLVADVRAAGGTWTAYRRQSRKEVLRLRSLILRDRARSRRRATGASDPVVARVLRLPNEMCWHVLKFWRATSAATGEVI